MQVMISTLDREVHILWHVPQTGLLVESFLFELLVNGDEPDIV